MFDATTILAYKGKNKAVIGGDGQVTFGNTVLKGNATKIRKLYNGQILSGFAGSTADAFNLYDMFETHLESTKGDLLKAVIAFSKERRKDKVLRRLEAMMIVLNKEHIFILNNQIEYIELNNIPVAVKIIIDIFFSTVPNNIKNSPIKLDVPGKPKFANEKKNKIDA